MRHFHIEKKQIRLNQNNASLVGNVIKFLLIQWGTTGLTCLHYLFTTNSQRHLEGPFWLKWQGNKLGKMAGKQNWLEWQGNKLV